VATPPPLDALRRPDDFSPAQRRIIGASLELFAEHGVSGTSLQMIADAIGVTKAAVYHQFRTKDEIVLAVAEHELAELEDALDAAARLPSREEGRLALLTSVIDLAVQRRRWVNALQNDPVMIRLLGTHPPLLDLMRRVYALLLGEEPATADRVRIAIVSGAIGAAVVHPLVAGLDDDTLRAELLAVAERLFDALAEAR
jgi:AcrR family transcriptional regulator